MHQFLNHKSLPLKKSLDLHQAIGFFSTSLVNSIIRLMVHSSNAAGEGLPRRGCAFAFMLITAMFATLHETQATIIASHYGNNDPVTEGWIANTGPGVTLGPVSNDGGFNAWSIDDNSSASGSVGSYKFFPSASDVAQAQAKGWVLRFVMRVVDVPDAADNGVSFEFQDGVDRWEFSFGSESDGDPVFNITGGPSFTFNGGGSGYHIYELFYDPVADSADIAIDGELILSNLSAPAPAVGTFVRFGAGSSVSTGHGRYNHVEFEVLPEPSSLMLAGLGAAGALLFVRRRR